MAAFWISITEWWTGYKQSWQRSLSCRFPESPVVNSSTTSTHLHRGLLHHPGARLRVANLKIHVGCYYFFPCVSVSLFLAGLLEYNLALRDEGGDNRELDRPMAVALGSIFMLACLGSFI